MKKYIIIATSFASVFIYNFGHSFMNYGFGDSSGAPLKKSVVTSYSTCASSGCHISNGINSERIETTHSITSDIPTTGWEAGKTYTIEIETKSPNKDVFGFQFLAWGNKDSSSVGTFTVLDKEKTQITSSTLKNKFYQNVDTLQYMTHKGADGILAHHEGHNVWSFQWTAPATKDQEVFFYTTFVVADGNGKPSNDYVFQLSTPATQQLLNVSEKSTIGTYKVYPTYFENSINVNLGTFEKMKHEIHIFNTTGQLVHQEIIDNHQAISTNHLPQGHYVMAIRNVENGYKESIKIYK